MAGADAAAVVGQSAPAVYCVAKGVARYGASIVPVPNFLCYLY